jgi:hypothetical protein
MKIVIDMFLCFHILWDILDGSLFFWAFIRLARIAMRLEIESDLVRYIER